MRSSIRQTIARWKRRAQWEWHYARLRPPKSRRDLMLDEPALLEALRASPIPMETGRIDQKAYHHWLDQAEYDQYHSDYYRENLPEKSLEHFLAAQWLNLQSGQDYLDIASETGTAAEIYERLYGVNARIQDLSFAPGSHGRRIGGNAAALPLEGNSIDAMALHCSFEHFEGDSDRGFIREMTRVLRPGGRCVIVPLYLSQYYACLTDPLRSGPGQVAFESDITVVALRTWPNRHGRFYDIPHLIERVWNERGPCSMRLIAVENYRDISPTCYLRFGLVFEKS